MDEKFLLNLSFFCRGMTRAILPNLSISDLSIFVWLLHDNGEMDGKDLTLWFGARVEKPSEQKLYGIYVVE